MQLAHGRPKRFETVMEAKLAVEADENSAVYRNAKEVMIFTSFGIGKFSVEEWDMWDE